MLTQSNTPTFLSRDAGFGAKDMADIPIRVGIGVIVWIDMPWPPEKPQPFLNVVVKELAIDPALLGLCAGYEHGEWRAGQFAAHLIEWLPEFALSPDEIELINPGNMIRAIASAATRIYTTEKYKGRGDFGEVLLHAIIRQEFDSSPVISKFFHKDSDNETVHGFDAVHVVSDGEKLELWLGEAKFHQDIAAAIASVIGELHTHFGKEYLKSEFSIILRKLDKNIPHADKLKKLLDKNTSLDVVFDCLCVPVLLTYDSEAVKNYSISDEAYKLDLQEEVLSHRGAFIAANPPADLTVYLFLVPLESIKTLRAELDARLKAAQAMG